MLETVKSNSTRQIDELKSENEQLNRTVETLRKRSKINAEGRAKDIEKENKVESNVSLSMSHKSVFMFTVGAYY